MSDDKKLEIRADHDGPLAVVRIIGPIVRDNQIHLRKELERLVSDGITQLAIDLKQVDYMDSAGLGCCSAVQKLISRRGAGVMAVFAPVENVEKIWTLIRLDLVIPVFPDEDKAIRWLKHRSPPQKEP